MEKITNPNSYIIALGGVLAKLTKMITLESYGQHGIRDCESTHDRMTNWLYLFLITLASVNLLQYHMRLGGGSEKVA